MTALSRRRFIAITAALAAAGPLRAETLPKVHVVKDTGCGCCNDWIGHIRDAGFPVSFEDMEAGALDDLKASLGLKPGQPNFDSKTPKLLFLMDRKGRLCNYGKRFQASFGAFRASRRSNCVGVGEEMPPTERSAIVAVWRCTLARISRAVLGLALWPLAFRRMRMTR